MKLLFITLFTAINVLAFSQTSKYEAAWDALNKNDRAAAKAYLAASVKEGKNVQDAYITNLYLDLYDSNANRGTNFTNEFYSKFDNSYPYIFSLWFNEAVGGAYGKKKPFQLDLFNKLLHVLRSSTVVLFFSISLNASIIIACDSMGAWYQ